MPDIAATGFAVKDFLLRVADHAMPHFGPFAAALKDELQGKRLTNERWNRIAAAMAAFHSIPGVALGPTEHDRRNLVLASRLLAGEMARATFGTRWSESTLELIEYRMRELELTLARQQRPKSEENT